MEINLNKEPLVLEIDRQFQVLSKNGSTDNHYSAKQSITLLSEQGDGYRNCLSRLRTGVFHQLSVDDQDCLWKIPTFSSPLSSFIQPEVMLQRANAICKIRRQRSDNYKYTDDTWTNPSILADPIIQSWASREVSSTIIVQGSSQSTDRLCHFSCDIVNHLLGQKYATVYILNSADTREYFKRLGADELLRQISSQLLRQILSQLLRQISSQLLRTTTTDMLVLFLVQILPRFQNASTTSKEWFDMLELLMQKLTTLFIVIDASVLQDQAKTAGIWVAEFDAIFKRLQKEIHVCTKVMILSNRRIDTSPDESLHMHIETNKNRIIPGKASRPPTIPPLPFYTPTKTPDENGNEMSRPRTNRNDADNEENMSRGSFVRDKGNANTSTFDQPSSAHYGMAISVAETRLVSVQTYSQEYQRRQEIEVAVICALSCEADAVEVLCDKIYDIHDFGIAAGDLNVYNVVQIGRHKVVILFMPAMGKSNAAASAVNCLHSFPNIRIALLTGICGGIPSPYTNTEIFLGDVVVSDRLVVYDFGRQFPGGFRRKDTTMDNARKPLPGIAAFLSKLKTRSGSERLSRRMADHLDWLRHGSPHGDWAAYPGAASDVLYEATYHHKHHDGDCDECGSSTHSVCEDARESRCQSLHCDVLRTISRKRLARQDHDALEMVEPAIHFGAYASGDIVMKSGEDRDEIGRREKVIAFEMEGAGIWDNMPTIIIKGVCDYADSHKNKDWQKYAATTAAACVKALLEDWPTQPQIYSNVEASSRAVQSRLCQLAWSLLAFGSILCLC